MSEQSPPHVPDDERPVFFEDDEGKLELLEPFDEDFATWVAQMPTDSQFRSMRWVLGQR